MAVTASWWLRFHHTAWWGYHQLNVPPLPTVHAWKRLRSLLTGLSRPVRVSPALPPGAVVYRSLSLSLRLEAPPTGQWAITACRQLRSDPYWIPTPRHHPQSQASSSTSTLSLFTVTGLLLLQYLHTSLSWILLLLLLAADGCPHTATPASPSPPCVLQYWCVVIPPRAAVDAQSRMHPGSTCWLSSWWFVKRFV